MTMKRPSYAAALLAASCLLPVPGALAQTDVSHAAGHAMHHDAKPGESANAFMQRRSFESLVASFESAERMAWQRPGALLELLEPLEGQSVADIGSGSGFLAFMMAERGADKVLCIDIDERFLAYILGKRDALGLGEVIEPRLSPPDRPALEAREVDLVVTVNTYHHIEDRPAYFAAVREALRDGGRLVVVDFRPGDLPVGPPASMKIPPETIEAELREAGFSDFSVDGDTLPYQFVLVARESAG